MSTISRQDTQEQTDLVRQRIASWGEPLSFNEFRLLITTMVTDGVLHADWFLMVNSTSQLLKLEGLVL